MKRGRGIAVDGTKRRSLDSIASIIEILDAIFHDLLKGEPPCAERASPDVAVPRKCQIGSSWIEEKK